MKRCLTFFMEGSQYSQNRYWDGNIRHYSSNKFNIGFLHIVLEEFNKQNIQYELINFDKSCDFEFAVFHEKMRDYQIQAITNFFENKYGIIKISTRGGKTLLSAETVRIYREKHPNNHCLFLVDTLDLFEQAKTEFKEHLNIKIGEINSKNMNFEQVTIGMIQTIQRCVNSSKSSEKKTNLLNYLKKVNFVIVDEVHEYSSPKRVRIVDLMKNKDYLLSLSATPFKSTDKFASLNVMKVFGQVVFDIEEKLLIENKHLSEYIVILLDINHSNNRNIRGNTYRDLHEEVITHNIERNHSLIMLISIVKRLKLKTLVLFSSKKHGYHISKLTGDLFLSGDDNLNTRLEVKKQFLKGEGKVLLASDIYKKGITLPEAQVMINAAGGKEDTLIIQKKGRVLGTTIQKSKALIVDFIDNYEMYFGEHSLHRIDVYEKSVGIDNIYVIDNNDKNLISQLTEVIKHWFEE